MEVIKMIGRGAARVQDMLSIPVFSIVFGTLFGFGVGMAYYTWRIGEPLWDLYAIASVIVLLFIILAILGRRW